MRILGHVRLPVTLRVNPEKQRLRREVKRPQKDRYCRTCVCLSLALANLLGVPVTAPLGFTWYDATKGLIGTSETDPGPVSSPGQWKTFFPNGH